MLSVLVLLLPNAGTKPSETVGIGSFGRFPKSDGTEQYQNTKYRLGDDESGSLSVTALSTNVMSDVCCDIFARPHWSIVSCQFGGYLMRVYKNWHEQLKGKRLSCRNRLDT